MPDTERKKKWHDLTEMWNLKKLNTWNQRVEWRLPGVGGMWIRHNLFDFPLTSLLPQCTQSFGPETD